MLLFRSEEPDGPRALDHVDAWSAQRSRPRGETMTVLQCWELARAWYGNRLDADWRRRTADEASAVFARLGLVGPFWRLEPAQTTD